MKLVRYGAIGAEKPGLIDQNGDLRDLSSHVADIAGAALQDAELEKLRALDPNNFHWLMAARAWARALEALGNFCVSV